MEGKGNFFILLVIVGILAITLAILTGYLFFVTGSTQGKAAEVASEEEIKRPAESELLSKRLYEEKKYFNLKSNNMDKISVLMVNAEIFYFKKVKGIRDIEAKIAANESKIKEMMGTFFQNMTLEEAMIPETRKEASKELTKKINECLLSNEKVKDDIIYEIVFDEWFYQ